MNSIESPVPVVAKSTSEVRFHVVEPQATSETKFHIVDSIMGSGKSQGAIAYINEHPGWKFIVVTPYLAEIERFIRGCPGHDFKEPMNDENTKINTKTASLSICLDNSENIVMTHKLFFQQTQEIEKKYRGKGYHLIVDESPENSVSEIENITPLEIDFLLSKCITLEEDGSASWVASPSVRYSDVEELCNKGRLRGYVAESKEKIAKGIFDLFPSSIFDCFEETILLTYLFQGQIFKGYLNMTGIQYDYWYVAHPADKEYHLTPTPQPFQSFNYKEFIHIYGADEEFKINDIGKGYYALSKSWYEAGLKDDRLDALSANLYNYFHNFVKAKGKERLWTTFKSYDGKLGQKWSYTKSFLSCNTRATNDFRERTKLAYLVNRFMVPSYLVLFARNNILIDNRLFALQEMLQWIWRSAIRDGKPIEIYIPSERMRSLLMQWLDYVSGEKEYLFEPDEAVVPYGDLASEK